MANYTDVKGEWLVFMRKKIMLMLVSLMLLFSVTACNKRVDSSTVNELIMEPDISQSEEAEGFDMERIRKSIVLKGVPFEMPMAFSDLGKDWTWEHYDYLCDDGNGLVDVYYKGELCFYGTVENYFKGSEDGGIIYKLSIETSDCSIDGFIPGISTKQEVMERYGEPIVIREPTKEYIYGESFEDYFPKLTKTQRISITFNEDDTIKTYYVTYYVDVEDYSSVVKGGEL